MKTHFIFTALAVFFALQILVFTACSEDSDSGGDDAPKVTENDKIFTISFDKNNEDAIGEMEAISGKYGEQTHLPKCTFTLTGYKFSRWKTLLPYGRTYSDTDYYQQFSTNNITLYAVWELKKCKATFDKNGATSGELTDETEYTYGEIDYFSKDGKFTFPENVFSYDADHVFVGWSTVANPTDTDKIYLVGEKVIWLWDGDQTFYAVWGDKNDNPLKVNDTKVGDVDSFVFDTSETSYFVFTGELFSEDFKKILNATKGLQKGVSLDFSQCEGVPFVLKNGKSDLPVVDKMANIKSLVLPPNLAEVPAYFFWGNKNLRYIKVNGKTETINGYAFSYCSLSRIELGEGIKTIDGAFYQSAITSITIPKSVTSLLTSDFCSNSCNELCSITVADGNENYSSADGVLFNKDKTKLFIYPCKKDTDTYSVPSSVTEISGGAFSDNKNLQSINIPASVTSIGYFRIYNFALSYDAKFSSITVDAANKNYSSEYGVLYNKDKTILIKYPCSKADTSFAIPNTVSEIKTSAFEGATNLLKIYIPQSVQTIETSVYQNLLLSTPFLFCRYTLKIYCEAEKNAIPAYDSTTQKGFGYDWNVFYKDSTKIELFNVGYGVDKSIFERE